MLNATFVVFSLVLRCKVEISCVFLGAFQVVVGPLERVWEDELAPKEILVQLVGGAALMGRKGGWVTPLQKKTFDSTMGFPGGGRGQATSKQLNSLPS